MRNFKPPSQENIHLTPKARGPNSNRPKTRQQKRKVETWGVVGYLCFNFLSPLFLPLAFVLSLLILFLDRREEKNMIFDELNALRSPKKFLPRILTNH
ncbi:transmembrane protein, putative [Medicago truncatula]|uniref:Transmembrane protein, putative n=1 Tax=Medicago truncatula TaxID=3880 RepID=A0A072U061_MEDTR|nr:transmembrane protein, putative [Medicago truncatula]